jgi:hypothetical protein
MSIRFFSSSRLALTIGCSALALSAAAGASHAGDLINSDSLLVTATTYEDVGQVAGLVATTPPCSAHRYRAATLSRTAI